MLTIAQALEIAVQHQRAGRLVEAEQLCREIMQVDPRHVGATNLLGVHCTPGGPQ